MGYDPLCSEEGRTCLYVVGGKKDDFTSDFFHIELTPILRMVVCSRA